MKQTTITQRLIITVNPGLTNNDQKGGSFFFLAALGGLRLSRALYKLFDG